jgi:hypothetical protein
MTLDADIVLPATASITTMLWVFAAMLLVLHALLIRWLRLGKLGWKIVDYIWLGFALVGLITAVAQVRTTSATVLSTLVRQRATAAFEIAKSSLEGYAAHPGPICRTFVRTENSPPPNEVESVQREYDSTCHWLNAFARSLPSPPPPVPMQEINVPDAPKVTNEVLQQTVRGLASEFETFNAEVGAFKAMEARSQHSELEEILGYLGPLLIVLALALRATKVTGELLLDRGAKP